MYKVNFVTTSGQRGAAYVTADSDEQAAAKIKAYFNLHSEEIKVGPISFQFHDMFLELESDSIAADLAAAASSQGCTHQ